MSGDDFSDDVLRSAYRAVTDEAADSGADADRIWEAASGSAPVAERRRVVDEMARDPGSALLWRLARELRPEAEAEVKTAEARAEARPAAPARAKRPIVWFGALAAAAVLVLAVGTWWKRPGPATAPQYRAPERGGMAAGMPDRPLDRNQFVLRWAPVEGARYDVRVTTEALVEIAAGRDLDRPEFTVPAAQLGSLAAGSRVLWQVTARGPSGAEVTSETFVSVIE
jgi:hypothetical protein